MDDPEVEKFLRQLKGPPIKWREALIQYAYMAAWFGLSSGLACLFTPKPGRERRMLFGAIGAGILLLLFLVAVAAESVSARRRRRSQNGEERKSSQK